MVSATLQTAICVQVPFFATHETKRKRGYGRALVEAIEEVRHWAKMLLVPLHPVFKHVVHMTGLEANWIAHRLPQARICIIASESGLL